MKHVLDFSSRYFISKYVMYFSPFLLSLLLFLALTSTFHTLNSDFHSPFYFVVCGLNVLSLLPFYFLYRISFFYHASQTTDEEVKAPSSNFFFQALLENRGNIVLVLNSELRIIYNSPCFSNLTGFSEHELRTRLLFEICSKATKDQLSQTLMRSFEGLEEKQAVEFTCLTKNNSEITFEGVLLNKLSDSDVNGLVLYLTEKEKLSLGSFRGIIDRVSDGFFSLNKQLCYTYVNKKIGEMTRRDPKSLLGKYIWDEFPEAVGSDTYRAIEKALKEQVYVSNTDYYEPLNLWQENHIYPSKDGLSVFIRNISEKKIAELSLQKSEKRFRAIVENTIDIISLTDKTGKIVYVNPTIKNIIGYSPEEIIDKKMPLSLHPDHVEASQLQFQELLDNPGVLMPRTSCFLHKNGSHVWMEGTVINLLHDPNVQAIVSNYHDITERMASEHALRKSEERYRNLFQNLIQAYAYCELIYDGEKVVDFRYLAMNKAHEKLLGTTAAIGKKMTELYPGNDPIADEYFALLNKMLIEECPQHAETYVSTLDKWYNITLYSPAKNRFVALLDDTTEKKKYTEQQSLFQSIVNSSQDAIFSRDLEGKITSWNSSAEKLFGYTPQEAIGMHIKQLIPENLKQEWEDISEKINNRIQINHFETRRTDKNGIEIPVSLTVSPILCTNGNLLGASVIARDISERQAIEDKIRNSEINLRTIFENSTETFTLLDREFNIITFNSKARECPVLQFGKTPVKENTNFFNYIHPARKELLRQTLNRVLTGEQIQYSSDFYSTKTKPYWFQASFIPVTENNQVVGVCVAVTDITKSKVAENQLLESEENLKAVFENTTQGFLLLEPDGMIKLLNKNAIKYSKAAYGKEIEMGRSLYDFIEESRVEFLHGAIQKVLKGETISYTRSYNRENGETVWLDFSLSPVLNNGTPVGVCVTGNNITEKMLSAQQKEFDQMNLKSLINNTSDPMWSIDRNFRLITSNKAFEKLTKLTSGVLLSTGNTVLLKEFGEDVLNRYKSYYERAFTGESFSVTEYNERPQPSWSEISFHPIYNGTEIVGTACFSSDITLSKKHAEEKEILIQELSQNNKDLKQFAYITSHNLRGPIANLLGLTNLLDKHKVKNPTLNQILDGIKKSALRFDETIKDLTDILTIKDNLSIPREKLAFPELFEKAMSQCESLFSEIQTSVSTDFNAASEVYFNKSYLDSIFLNLLTNALKYRDFSRPLQINVRTRVEEGNTILEFGDNGIGIDLEINKDKIFKLYQRFHNSREGKGLGLFLVKSQVEALGGTIRIESEPDKGTRFIITFNAAKTQA